MSLKFVIACIISTHFVSTFGTKISPSQYVELKSDITTLIGEKNCAPILVRLAWHDSGTYDKTSDTGGPRAAQRFDSGESAHGANAGLDIARHLLSPLVSKYCETNIISISDLWAFAGNTAISVAKGPQIPFRFGRKDISTPSECVEDGRLPDAAQGTKHVRNVLNRIGFEDDKYIVALSGAHTLGACHVDRSGFEGQWTQDPYTFDNSYFKDLAYIPWDIDVSGKGLTQFINDDGGKRTIMLPSDWSLMADPKTIPIVKQYANDQKLFFKDFSVAWQRLIESGYNNDDLYSVETGKEDL